MAREYEDFEDKDFQAQPAGLSTGVKILIGLGAVLGLLIVAGFVAMVLALPARRRDLEEARRAEVRENLKQIGLAMRQYADAQESLPIAPPAVPVTEPVPVP